MEKVKKVCVLTGASGTLGRAFIEKYINKYTIIGTYNNRKIQDSIPIEEYDPNDQTNAIYSIHADLSQIDDVQKLCDMLYVHVGDIDLLINNAAAIYLPSILSRDGLVATEYAFRVNIFAPYRIIVSIARKGWKNTEVNKERNRNIINISSVSGSIAVNDGRYGGYAASKAALDHLTRHLAPDLLNRGIRVNAIAPDTFGTRVSIDTVLNSMVAVDEGDMTGQVIQVTDSN